MTLSIKNLSKEVAEHLQRDLKKRENRFNSYLDEHNNRKGMMPKEFFDVQGFQLKGINVKHANSRLRKLLVLAGFHPDVTAEHFENWKKDLTERINTEEE